MQRGLEEDLEMLEAAVIRWRRVGGKIFLKYLVFFAAELGKHFFRRFFVFFWGVRLAIFLKKPSKKKNIWAEFIG